MTRKTREDLEADLAEARANNIMLRESVKAADEKVRKAEARANAAEDRLGHLADELARYRARLAWAEGWMACSATMGAPSLDESGRPEVPKVPQYPAQPGPSPLNPLGEYRTIGEASPYFTGIGR